MLRMGAAAAAAAVVVVVLLAAPSAEAHGYMVVEETCERRIVPSAPTPCANSGHGGYLPGGGEGGVVVYPQQAAVVYAQPAVAVHGGHAGGGCSCGGSKHDGTCTCGRSKPVCSCGGSKLDGTCTCGTKGTTSKERDDMKNLAEEGITALFKVMRGGIRAVGHLAEHINKKQAEIKTCGCKKSCGCKPCGCVGGCGCGYRR